MMCAFQIDALMLLLTRVINSRENVGDLVRRGGNLAGPGGVVAGRQIAAKRHTRSEKREVLPGG